MSDQTKQANEEAKSTANVDLTKFVPKEDYEKLSASERELKTKLDDANLSLLDPEYIAFLETKKGKQVEKKVESSFKLTDSDIDKLSSKQLLELAVDKAKEAVLSELSPELEKKFKNYDMSLSDIYAVFELQACEKKYKDFEDFREDTRKILESSPTPISIEQAYKLAKADKQPPAKEEKPDPAKTAAEKPTGHVPTGDMQTKVFKNKMDAAEDAWNQVVGSGKDSI